MKKTKMIKKLTVCYLLLLLLGSTTLSFVFWQSGIKGNSDSSSFSGGIGQGTEVTTGLTVYTTLDTSANKSTINDRLIPWNREKANLTPDVKAVQELFYISSLIWQGDYDKNNSIDTLIPGTDFNLIIEFEETRLYGFDTLDISTRTMVVENPANDEWYKSVSHLDYLFLIEIDFNNSYFSKTTVDNHTGWSANIYWTLRMNEALDQTDYDLIINSLPTFYFNFIIETKDDINNR